MPLNDALVIAAGLDAWFLPSLFAAAGISCDLVTANPSYALSTNVRHLQTCEGPQQLAPAALQSLNDHGPYRWVIAGTDAVLAALHQHALLDAAYRPLLPLTPEARSDHLYSKIGLSRAFSASGVPTPAWRVARCTESARAQADALGWPLLLKRDASCSGRGVWRCHSHQELVAAVAAQPPGRPFLLQALAEGSLLAVEALFDRGQLLAYALSKPTATAGPHGPSLQRLYGISPADASGLTPAELEPHLLHMGHSLGLHGFSNLSLIHGPQHGPLFFECDMRPTAWLWLDHVLGGDFARCLHHSRSREEPCGPVLHCYSQLQQALVQPFLKPDSPAQWPYPPPDESVAFLSTVLQSGQLVR